MASFGIHVTNNNKSDVTYTYSHPCTYVVGKRQQKWALLGNSFFSTQFFLWSFTHQIFFYFFFKKNDNLRYFSFFCIYFLPQNIVFLCSTFSPTKILYFSRMSAWFQWNKKSNLKFYNILAILQRSYKREIKLNYHIACICNCLCYIRWNTS